MKTLQAMGNSLVLLYETVAVLFYLLVAFSLATWSLFWMATRREGDPLAEILRRPAVWGTALAVVVLQLMTSAMTVLFAVWERVEWELVGMVLPQWLMIALAGMIAPLGIVLAREQRLVPPGTPGVYWRDLTLATVGITFFSYGWFLALGVFVDLDVKEFFALMMSSNWALGALVPMVLAAAIMEEVIFRLGLQGLLERGCRRHGIPVVVAVALASAVWAVGHAGMMTPVGVKEGQIFLIGMVLGWLKIRHGASACIAGHLVLNASAVLIEVLFDFELY